MQTIVATAVLESGGDEIAGDFEYAGNPAFDSLRLLPLSLAICFG